MANIMNKNYVPQNRNQVVNYWHNRYGYNKDIIRVAMGIIEATSESSYQNKTYKWTCEGVEEELIQSFCRILQSMGDPTEQFDFRHSWKTLPHSNIETA